MNRGFSQYGTAASLLTADGHSLRRNKSHCFRLPHEAVKPTLEDATKGVADALSVRSTRLALAFCKAHQDTTRTGYQES